MHDLTLPDITDVRGLAGTYVLLRAALNTPLQNGAVSNNFRITRALPMIEYLAAHGARVIIVAHIGRDPKETLRPVYEAMRPFIPSLRWCDEVVGPRVQHERDQLGDGDVLLLENVRSHEGETSNDPAFAASLASLGTVYVNDAFADSHRAHASIVGVPARLQSYFGTSFIREYTALGAARSPEAPSLFILGGAKFETKLPLVLAYLKTYTHVFVGGALAHDIWRTRGYELGTSLVSDIDLTGHPILDADNLLLPIDVTVVGPDYTRVTTPDAVQPGEMIVDAGPKTVDMLANYILAARSILWNGPLGNYELGYETATKRIAEVISDAPGTSVVGGGDTVASIESLCIGDTFDFLSIAGGAMLAFLEHGTLPAIEALTQARR